MIGTNKAALDSIGRNHVSEQRGKAQSPNHRGQSFPHVVAAAFVAALLTLRNFATFV